jgi:hypothetical protein
VEVSKRDNAGVIPSVTSGTRLALIPECRYRTDAAHFRPDYLLLGIRHLLMIYEHHKVSLTPLPAVYGRALSTISSMDVQGVSPPPALASLIISVRYRSNLVPDWISLFRYRSGPGIGASFHSGTGMTRCWTVRHTKKLF